MKNRKLRLIGYLFDFHFLYTLLQILYIMTINQNQCMKILKRVNQILAKKSLIN